MTPGQIALLIVLWLAVSTYSATCVGCWVAWLRFGPPVPVGVDWPWWKAFRYGQVMFAALQVGLMAAFLLL